jgi:hypothetical protein
MSTLQISFKTKLGFISITEVSNLITQINFAKGKNQKISSNLKEAKKEILKFIKGERTLLKEAHKHIRSMSNGMSQH